jgi:hypothetical protein
LRVRLEIDLPVARDSLAGADVLFLPANEKLSRAFRQVVRSRPSLQGIVRAMQSGFLERRSGVERRHHSLRAYWRGARHPRRRTGRRAADAFYPIVDWHSPRILAWVVSILLLCAADGVLTVILLANGAVEANPFMALFVPHSLGWFAAVKLSLTSIGTIVLVAFSRMRLFRTIPIEAVLALIVAAYAVLIAYELRLLERIH